MARSTRPAVWTRQAEPTVVTTALQSGNLPPVQQRRHRHRRHRQHRQRPNFRSTSSTEKKRFRSATFSSVTPTSGTWTVSSGSSELQGEVRVQAEVSRLSSLNASAKTTSRSCTEISWKSANGQSWKDIAGEEVTVAEVSATTPTIRSKVKTFGNNINNNSSSSCKYLHNNNNSDDNQTTESGILFVTPIATASLISRSKVRDIKTSKTKRCWWVKRNRRKSQSLLKNSSQSYQKNLRTEGMTEDEEDLAQPRLHHQLKFGDRGQPASRSRFDNERPLFCSENLTNSKKWRTGFGPELLPKETSTTTTGKSGNVRNLARPRVEPLPLHLVVITT